MSHDRFTSQELAAITEFARAFRVLYGGKNYRSDKVIRGALPIIPGLIDLVVKLLADKDLFGSFRRELNRLIAVGEDEDLHVAEPSHSVADVLNVPVGTLMTVLPKGGFTDVDRNWTETRERWMQTRLFHLSSEHGIVPLTFNPDTFQDPELVTP
jgi:hypothetical protein